MNRNLLRSILLLALFGVLCLADTTGALIQTGKTTNPVWTPTPNHILHSTRTKGRFIDYEIKFLTAYQTIPKVAIVNHLLDWELSVPNGYFVEITKIDLTGFILRVTAPTERVVYSIFTQWVASNDPNFHVQYVHFKNLDQGMKKMKCADSRKIIMQVPIENWRNGLKTQFEAIPFINGLVQTGAPYSLFTRIHKLDYQNNKLSVRIQTDQRSVTNEVRLAIIMVQGSNYFVAKTSGFRVPNLQHPWIQRSPSGSTVNVEVKAPNGFIQSNNLMIVGFSGFEMWDRANTRLSVNCKIESTLNCDLSTWWDSKTVEMDFNLILYRAQSIAVYIGECFLDEAKSIPCPK